jgi:hypothetical protein
VTVHADRKRPTAPTPLIRLADVRDRPPVTDSVTSFELEPPDDYR